MPAGTDVPLKASREPGLSKRDVGELQGAVGMQELLARAFVRQLPNPAAKAREHDGAEVTVFQDDGGHLVRRSVPAVGVLHPVRKDVGHASIGSGCPWFLRAAAPAPLGAVQL